jgi:hypothetical protein
VIYASATSVGCNFSPIVIHARASDTDTDGISAVKMWYTLNGVTIYGPISMTYHPGIYPNPGYWSGSITDPGWGATNGQISYWVQAFDSRGSWSATTYPPATWDITYNCIQ